ncbi:NADPH-dependent FMN reductase [Devosia insulae DS-56]|uniref:NADPH-dependent FMN reductase n=1 Tax=Devosia insulae DS-56 TaxID=1116389 RepID=A0A1E5XHP4_9HYPH|nr:NAD(P)H-dependent oxidoreductase [Devosia insulae]OEO28105.1 NADPH-dependent FMN reductase [Devosia insulae DS-56]
MDTPTIAVVVGSLRHDSLNLRLARAIEKLMGASMHCRYLQIGELPLYNNDLWENPPSAVVTFKQELLSSDAVLFVTPEYNRSIPGVLKNAIDWGSRPLTENAWRGKPAAILGGSPGMLGTAVAQSHLRSILPALDLRTMPQPEVYLQLKPGLIDDSFAVTNEATRTFLSGFVRSFAHWISRQAGAL